MDAIIFDIDGTLADVRHRRHHITEGKKDWDQFFKEMVSDPPFADVCYLAELIARVDKPPFPALFIFSGRPDTYRTETEGWLQTWIPDYWGQAHRIMMRREGDYRSDTEVKREMLYDVQGQGYNVRLVIDDRPSVVEMWKSEGITVLVHDNGDWDE